MFGLSKLLGVLGAMIVVPTVAYVLGETTADMGSSNSAADQKPAVVQDVQNPDQPPGGGGYIPPGDGMMGGRERGSNGGQFPGGSGMMGGTGQGNGFMDGPGQGNGMMGGTDNKNKDGFQPPEKRCQQGEFWGRNDKGEESCIRPGQRGSGSDGMQGFQQNLGNIGDFQKNMKDDQDRMEKDRQAREQDMMNDMKKNAPKGVKQPLSSLKKQITRVEALKITVPEEIKKFITDVESALAALEAAQTMDEAQDAMMTLQDAPPQFGDYFRILEEARNWPRMSAEAKRQLKSLEKTLSSAMRQSQRKGAIDISTQTDQLSQEIVALKATFESAQQKITSGEIKDIEEGLSLIQDDFFGSLQDLDDTRRTIDMLGNISRTLKNIPTQLKQYARDVKQLKAKKVDTSEADALLVEMNAKLSEIKTLASAKPVDEETLVTAVESGAELMEKFEDLRDQLQGKDSQYEKLFNVDTKSIPKMDLGITTPLNN